MAIENRQGSPSEGSQQVDDVIVSHLSHDRRTKSDTVHHRLAFHDSLLGSRVHAQYSGYIVYKRGIET